MTERTALVVDDQSINRLLACTLLQRLGWQVQEADSGEKALELAEKNRYQLILMDISMPGMSGEEACEKLRQKPDIQAKIVAYTAHAQSEDYDKFLSLGFDDVLIKPLSRQRLEEVASSC